ncbi:MAG: hypothetical protein LBT39_09760, partial [Treponema sp.]|nr:hypothetical protein [Treponema sp.]
MTNRPKAAPRFRSPRKRAGTGSGLLVKSAAISGLLLATVLGGLLLFFALQPDRNYFNSPGIASRDVFHRLLRDYDLIAAATPAADRVPERLATLGGMLDKMEKNAQGVESWLSLLKRRRALAGSSPAYLIQYRAAARRAAATFPYSEPLAAISAAATLKDAPISPETAATLRGYTELINDTQLMPLALGIAILAGDFNYPGQAAASRGEALLTAALPIIRPRLSQGAEDRLIVNLVLLRLIKQDYRGADAQLRGVSQPNSPATRRFLGEYYYDFGDPLRAAEIFIQEGDEKGLLRAADALWLGGKAPNAINLWLTLSGASTGRLEAPTAGPENFPATSAARLRSLYNLAATASTAQEQDAWFTRAYQAGQLDPALREDPCYHYGLVGYTRTLPPYD